METKEKQALDDEENKIKISISLKDIMFMKIRINKTVESLSCATILWKISMVCGV